MYKKKFAIQDFLIQTLVLLMPLHIFIFYLVDNKGLSLWRDAFIILLILTNVLRNGKIKYDKYSIIILLACSVGLVHALFFHDRNMSAGIWMNTYRVYFMPALAYFAVINARFSKDIPEKLRRLFVIESLLICIFGIVQQFLIGKSFTDFMGYRRASITFANGIQRNIGLFDSANIMSLFLIFAIILCLRELEVQNKKYHVILGVLILGVVLTFSFTGYLVLGIVLFCWNITRQGFAIGKIKRLAKWGILIVFGAGVVLAIDSWFMNSLIYTQISSRILELNMALNADSLINNTSSAAVHIRSLTEPIEVLRNNLFGVGFSTSTFMVLGKVDFLQYAVESSLFTILYDFGVFAGTVYLFTILYPLVNRKLFPVRRYSYERLLYLALCLYFITLPLVQSYELRFWIFLFLGLAKYEEKQSILKQVSVGYERQ